MSKKSSSDSIDGFSAREYSPDELEELATSQLVDAVEAYRRGFKHYESLKNLNEVISTQYGDRVLLELVQNAHDAHSPTERGEISIKLVIDDDRTGTLYVANRGQGFSYSNFDAIRNIGTSDKKIGEGIGNKGLGFRSIEVLTDDVRIYSKLNRGSGIRFDGYCFRFARNDEIKERLLGTDVPISAAAQLAQNIPRYLIPLPIHERSPNVLHYGKSGYATVIELPLRSTEAVEIAKTQVQALADPDAPVLLFLERLAKLNIEVVAGSVCVFRKQLTREVREIDVSSSDVPFTLSNVKLESGDRFIVVRMVLPKQKILRAVRDSIPYAPTLERWVDWKDDAVVSIAVGASAQTVTTARMFNFLPMDSESPVPIHGYLNAPFFADIDRRSINHDLPLNRYLLEAAAEACAAAALKIIENKLAVDESSVVDLITWSQPHVEKILEGFEKLEKQFASSDIWPVMAARGFGWSSLENLYQWPTIGIKYLKPRRLAKVVNAAILPTELGEKRLARIADLAKSVLLPLDLQEEVLAGWVAGVASNLASVKGTSKKMWGEFYDDIVTLFSVSSLNLSVLQGKPLFIDGKGGILEAKETSTGSYEPIFVRSRGARGRNRSGPPKPPSSLSRRLKFLDDQIALSEDTLREFEKAGLVRRYDALEVLESTTASLAGKATDIQRRDCLRWTFRVWLNTGGGGALETVLFKAKLHVPTSTGWTSSNEAFFSASWTRAGKDLELFLRDACGQSPDCAHQKERLLQDYEDWPVTSTQDRKSDWVRFLNVLGVRDGLHPIAGKIKGRGTPSNYWHRLFFHGDQEIGLGDTWVRAVRAERLAHPQTEYLLEGKCWRFPGQLEHDALTHSAKETLSCLITAYLKDKGSEQFEFEVVHWRGVERAKFPTPLQLFLRDASWMSVHRRNEASLSRPSKCWSTQTLRQVPPQFVHRFTAEPGIRISAPDVFFDERVGLRDWTASRSVVERLSALADALNDLSASERREMREQLRRTWADISKEELSFPPDLQVIVESATGLECLKACTDTPPLIYLTTERESFAARALIDQGKAVLDLGEADISKISTLLDQTSGFTPRPIDASNVKLLVDDVSFEPDSADPLLVSGELNWLSHAAVLAHEFLGDPFELRNLPPETLDQRIRQIRIRRCSHFAVIIDENHVSSGGYVRAHPFPHSRLPTLVIESMDEVDIDTLLEAAPAITKLVGARSNTIETMLSRLLRLGFNGGSISPTDEQFALAIQREVSIVRDHFAAMRGGVEKRVRAVLPIIYVLMGRDMANELTQAYEQLGPSLHLRNWLEKNLGSERSDAVWQVLEVTDNQVDLRRRLDLPFAQYNAALHELGYPPLCEEVDYLRIFEVYLNEMRSDLVDRVRRRYIDTFRNGGNLAQYFEHKKLNFVTFDPEWPLTVEELTKPFVEDHILNEADRALGQDSKGIELPDICRVTSENQKMALSAHARITSLVCAWCRSKSRELPDMMNPADSQPLVSALLQAGLFDFERLLPDQLPELCKRIDIWPEDMPTTLDLEQLSLTEEDLDFEARKARESRHQAEVSRRSIDFGGNSLDTGSADFAQSMASIAAKVLVADSDWFSRSRAPRLVVQQQFGTRGSFRSRGDESKTSRRREQPPEPIRCAMGMASEYLAREYLMKRHPKEMTDSCWVSENREHFCADGEKGDDSLGYDFRVVTMRNEWLYEVKSAIDEGGEFEMTAREIEVAGSGAMDRKRRFRILYVPFVFDPRRWSVLMLQNPVGQKTRDQFRIIRTGSVRYGFDLS